MPTDQFSKTADPLEAALDYLDRGLARIARVSTGRCFVRASEIAPILFAGRMASTRKAGGAL